MQRVSTGSGMSCGYTAQGEYVCPPGQGNQPGQQAQQAQQAQRTAGRQQQIKRSEGFQMNCPADPRMLPLCSIERSRLVGSDGTCNQWANTDPITHHRCELVINGCCQENGVPPQAMAMGK